MLIIAYIYNDPVLEPTPDHTLWGWEIDRVYQDISGRQELENLLKYCREKTVNYLLIRKLEELGDSVQEVSDRLLQLESLNIKLIVTESVTNPDKIQDFVPVNRIELLQLLNQLQKEYHSRQIRRGHAHNRIKAIPPPGKAPYGYRRGKDRYALDRTAATVVKDFFEHFLLYGSLRGAVRHIGKKYGKKISASTGHRWLTSPVYRGDLQYQNGDVVKNTHLAIISREEGAQVDRLLRRNRRLPSRTASAPRSLAGLVICQKCRSHLTIANVTTHGKGKNYLYLRPINCPNQPKCSSISYQEVLDVSIAKICQELPIAVAKLKIPDTEAIKQGIFAVIAGKIEILEKLPELISQGILDQETADLRSYKLRTEIAKLQDQIAQFPPVNLKATAQAVCWPQFWQDLSESERRFYFREFITEIELIRDGDNWQIEIIFIFNLIS